SVNHLKIISASDLNGELAKNRNMIIGKKVVVPIMNTRNSEISYFENKGLSADNIKSLLLSGRLENDPSGKTVALHFYLPNNPEVLKVLSDYSLCQINNVTVSFLNTEKELIEAIQNDATGIGFCFINDAANAGLTALKENLALVPIDKNNNGRIDTFEKIYNDPEAFMRGVWIGKYPRKLTEPIYAISSQAPVELEMSFLAWILKDGQNALKKNGYIVLTSAESNNGLALLSGSPETELIKAEPERSSALPLIILGLIIFGLIVAGVVKYFIWSKKSIQSSKIQFSSGMNEDSIDVPKGIFFDKSHTWAYMEQDGSVKVGVDDFLQHLTGPLTRVKMKESGEFVRKGEKFLTIMRNGKQLNLYSPVSGTISQQNTSLENNSRLINISPYKEGWVYKIEPKNWVREIEFLTMGSRYKEWLNTEFNRLRDFFAITVATNNSAYEHIVLQDGGELADNILADLDPKVWEDFQTQFIDISR
ncbi:MAG: hypothetical protein ACM3ME_05080, partial [Chloroflexota bacterium]